MYKSPIEIKLDDIVSDAVEKMDEYIVKFVQQVGVNVDKDEIIKALRYDRAQYEKGRIDRDNEIVRCKDCKFFDNSDFGKGEEYWCKHFVSTYDNTHCHKVTEDDFCSWGERKDETN